MPFLSTDKVLVILVVALVVLGPNKLPQVARQLGSFWADFQRFRQRVEAEVRDTFPDLPPTEVLTRAVRSPLTVLDELATTHGAAGDGDAAPDPPGEPPGAGAPDGAPAAQGDARPGPPRGTVPDEEVATGRADGGPGVRHAIRATRPVFLDDPSMN